VAREDAPGDPNDNEPIAQMTMPSIAIPAGNVKGKSGNLSKKSDPAGWNTPRNSSSSAMATAIVTPSKTAAAGT
jgi:hypothetical protein